MILMNDFRSEPEDLRQHEMVAVDRVLHSGWYVLGSEVKRFEAAWAKCCGTLHAIGVGNGMDALEIGLRSLDIGIGDEVITTSMTAFATVLAILRAGAVPVLADINPDTSLLNIESVHRCLSPRTKAVLLVHLYGQVREMVLWETFCKENNLILLEDCAQAHLAEDKGKIAGNFGKFGAYSFYPTKNLGAIGDAGALVTNDPEIANRSIKLRNYGQSERYHHPELGMNSRMDEIHAAILTERLSFLHSFTEKRINIAETYHQEISNPRIKLLARPLNRANHVYHLFVLLCEERDRLNRYLSDSGIASLSHYPIPVHKQPPCLSTKIDPLGLEYTEQHSRHCLSIPCHPQMMQNQIEKVIDVINSFR